MVNSWAEATDRTGSTVRVASFDYYKAFDLMKHRIPAKKVSLLSMPLFVKRLVINFFTNRQQGVRLARKCLSKWADILYGVPQQKKSGPWPFLLMIMIFSHLKCKPDTTISEVVPEGSTTNIQDAIESIQTWSTINRLQLNVAKWKVLEISFSKTAYHFPSLNRLWSAWSSYKC